MFQKYESFMSVLVVDPRAKERHCVPSKIDLYYIYD